jgi:quinol monooxygenase YgiN
MTIRRREIIVGAASIACSGIASAAEDNKMFGLIGMITVVAGQQDALINILLESTANMPGCLSYVIAKDAADQNAIWITEVWDSKASHDASLKLPAVINAIASARPMIAGSGSRVVTTPIGGHGLPAKSG